MRRHLFLLLSGASAIYLLVGNALAQEPVQPKDATEATRAANKAVLNELPFGDRQDFEDAKRGFIATVPS